MYCDMAMEVAGRPRHGRRRPSPTSAPATCSSTRQGSGLEDLKSLADPRLKKLKIGVNIYTSDAENSPPAMALSRYGVVGNLTGYSTFYHDSNRPEDIINGVSPRRTSTWPSPGGRWPATSPSSRRCRWC